MTDFKKFLRSVVSRCQPLRNLLCFYYQMSGQRPWSLGYSIYKFNYIFQVIQKNLETFRRSQLPKGYARGLDERAVEYPWVFAQLKASDKIILDAGSSLNHGEILSTANLRDRQLYIMTLAYEGMCFSAQSPSYIYGDLRSTCFQSDYFDAVVCISSLEHVGMDNSFYTGKEDRFNYQKYEYLKAITEFKRILKKGGTVYITVPYGLYKNHRWFQIFDESMIDKLQETFAPESMTTAYFKYENNQWNYADKASCQTGIYFDVRDNTVTSNPKNLAASECIACLKLTK